MESRFWQSRAVVLSASLAIALGVLAGCSKASTEQKPSTPAAQQQSPQTKQAAGKAAGALKADLPAFNAAVPFSLSALDGLVVSMPTLPSAVAPVSLGALKVPSVSAAIQMTVPTPSVNFSLGTPDLGAVIGAIPAQTAPTGVPTAIPTPPPGVTIPPGATPPAGVIPPGFPTPPAGFPGLPPGFTFP